MTVGQESKQKAGSVANIYRGTARAPTKPERILNSALRYQRDRYKIERIFLVSPSTKLFAIALAEYLMDVIPSNKRKGTLYYDCIRSATHEVYEHGVLSKTEIGGNPEIEVFKSFLIGIMNPVPNILNYRITVENNDNTYRCDPLRMGISEFWRTYGAKPRCQRVKKNEIPDISHKTVKLIIASRLLNHNDLVALGGKLDFLG